MSLNIKNPEAARLAAEVHDLTGESMTTAVIIALRERRERLLAEREQPQNATMADDLLALAAQIRSRLSDAELSADFLYDQETGLPA